MPIPHRSPTSPSTTPRRRSSTPSCSSVKSSNATSLAIPSRSQSLSLLPHVIPSWFDLADSSPNRNDRPFIIDLESANGTMVNDEAVPASRFYELRSGDGARFFPYLAALETVV